MTGDISGLRCDLGWTYIENGCFRYFPKSSTVTENESAEFDCNEKGGYLASIISAAQNEGVYDLVGNRMALIGLRGTQSLMTNERIWAWTDGRYVNYTNWMNYTSWIFGHSLNETFPETSTFFYHTDQWVSCDSSSNSSCWSQWDGYLCKVPASQVVDKDDDDDDHGSNPDYYLSSKTVNKISTGYTDSGAGGAALAFVVINFVVLLVLICRQRRQMPSRGYDLFFNPMNASMQRVALDECSSSVPSAPQNEVL